jgi:hypothetical protein
LPPGVHIAEWQEFQSRFCSSSPRRLWLSGRLRALLELAATSGKLRRDFVWGSFVTAKPAPKDIDILLIMDDDFEVDGIPAPAQAVFDSVRPKLLERNAGAVVGHLSNLQKLSETRYRGGDQMLLAQQCIANLRGILLEARKVHSSQDYARMAEPILLEIQQREQEIIEFFSREIEQPMASQGDFAIGVETAPMARGRL